MFCRQCGTQLPDDSKFCIVCGTPVVAAPAPGQSAAPAKEYLALFEGVSAGEKYDLYVTSSRFVLIRKASGAGLGAVLGPVGSVLDAGLSAAAKRKYSTEMTLDERLKKDSKNYVLSYTGMLKVRLSNSATGGRFMEVRYVGKGGKERKTKYGMSKAQVLEAEKLLPTIPAIAPKVQA